MRQRVALTLTIVLRSPFLMRGLGATSLGIDARALRDEVGRPLIPSDQVKGLLRAAGVTLAQRTGGRMITDREIDMLFGRASPDEQDEGFDGEVNRPVRGALILDDLAADEWRGGPGQGAWQATRVAIDPETGAAREGALQVVELAAPLGALVSFTGNAILFCGEGDRQRLLDALDRALALIPAIGALKSAGFGEVVRTELSMTSVNPMTLPAVTKAEGRHRSYRVRFDRRLLVDATRVAGNVWEGAAIVPGTALKGALAERLRRAGVNPENDPTWAQSLAALRITHAFPENGRGRPCGYALPASLIVDPERPGEPRDALLVPHDKAAMLNGRAPAYPLDWKPSWFGGIAAAVGYPEWEEPVRLPRGHTRIENHIAVEGDLYVDVARSSLRETDPPVPFTWRVSVHQGKAADDAFAQVLAVLETEGLDGIGATRATASFTPLPDEAPALPVPVEPDGRRWAVTLITPALMLNLDPCSGDDLLAQYQRYWEMALPGARLVTFYATQSFAGGYIAMRRRFYGRNLYHPFLLTDPGSVFLLDGDLGEALSDRCRTGLPALGPDGWETEDWRICPYLPQNGFGDFLVNAVDHAGLKVEERDHV